MPKEFYKEWNPRQSTLNLVDKIEQIIFNYQNDGYTLTLRQLYYQLVAQDIIENTVQSYKTLVKIMTNARMAGMIDWTAIEDRNREFNSFWFQENDQTVIDQLPQYIRFDQWARQDHYIEVWVEKEALGNVVSRACKPLLVPHMSCKGYLSASEAWRAGKRFERRESQGKTCHLIHLGDHDPSGIDMTRDNSERLEMFASSWNIQIHRIALNMDQIEELKPPPNPAKETDSRFKSYRREFGETSWELDAIKPQTLNKLITDKVHEFIDWDEWNDVQDQEIAMENLLGKLSDQWGDIKQRLQNENNED